VNALGYEDNFDIGESYLKSHIGSEFIYKGMRHNVKEIKSTEGIDIAWVEEAQSTSKESWETLIPTIRKAGSEVWVSFNPDLEGDPTYQRFVVDPPDNAIVQKVNYYDNPWFGEESRAEMEYCRRVDLDAYRHVWLGECKKHSDAQIFKGKVSIESFAPNSDWDGPYFGVDFGFSQDPTVMVKMWVHNNKLYFEHEAYGIGVEIVDTPSMFDKIPSAREYVSRADCSRPETISHIRQNGYKKIASCKKWKGSVEDGIMHMRSYEKIILHPRCTHTQQEFSLYSYKVDKKTGDVLPDIVDKFNHCIDAARYGLEPLVQRRDTGIAVHRAGVFG
jgi:phage terminase large subunit